MLRAHEVIASNSQLAREAPENRDPTATRGAAGEGGAPRACGRCATAGLGA